MPPGEKLPVLWWLSGLTCTHANAMEKCDYHRACAEHRVILVGPDTSPARRRRARRSGATISARAPGSTSMRRRRRGRRNFRMRTYVEQELPALSPRHSRSTWTARASTGHSMGGHGALTVALAQPRPLPLDQRVRADRQPDELPVGRKALGGYLGDDMRRVARSTMPAR